MTNKRWDIFCRVIDNYGDAGVCWRLACQLANEFNLSVRLWIDDLSALQKIYPSIDSALSQQLCANVAVCRWDESLPQPLQVADVVIEAFACEIPADYRAAMQAHRSQWINLEYLSAEDWVQGCHGLPSPQSGSAQNGVALKKYFFFPGFRQGTGGVLGERDLPSRRRAFQSDAKNAVIFLRQFGIEPAPSALRISLFAYRYAPIDTLLHIWSMQSQPIVCYVPEGQPLEIASRFFGETLTAGSIRQQGNLTVVALPFLSQGDYDGLLWSCDINFVRGEDSFVRAQWAARPFVWQIYAQEGGAHWPKLDAFMKLYGEQLPLAASGLQDFWRAWNGNGDLAATWPRYVDALPELSAAAEHWAQRLESGTNLAAALVQFCANQV